MRNSTCRNPIPLIIFVWVLLVSPVLASTSDISEAEHKNQEDSGHEHRDDHNKNEAHSEHDKKVEEADHEHGHDEDHDESKEGRATITNESAKRMGVIVEKAKSATIDQIIPLVGRITLNKDTNVSIRARFPGFVKSVNAALGEYVEKGQVLAVVESNASLKDYDIVAPISGVLLSKNTNIGNVAGDSQMFMIADLSNVWAKFHVFPRDADLVKIGQSIEIHTLERDKEAIGKIDMLFPTADELSQTQIAIVRLPNNNSIWKPGMTVEGDVLVLKSSVNIAVKESALQKMDKEGDVVFIQEGDNYEVRPVRIGRKGNGLVEIVGSLGKDDHYVSEGSFVIKSDILKSTAAHSH